MENITISISEEAKTKKQEIVDKLISGEMVLSFSAIKQFAQSPAHFMAYKLGQRVETPAMKKGTMIHCAILEPEELENRYTILKKEDLPNPEFSSALMCLGTYTASRVAEQVRSGINSVSTGVGMAGYATGLSTYQLYVYILLPIGYRIIIPPLTSEFLTIFKNSSLALTIGLLELTARSNMIMDWTFQGFEAYTAATVIYVSVTMIVTLIMQRIENKTQIPGFISKKHD